MQGPTYISSDIVAQEEAEFPAMTVCPESTKYKENVLQQHGIVTAKGYNYKVNLTWSSNQTDVSDAELFELATNRLDELLQRFQIRFFDTNPVSIFQTFASVMFTTFQQPFSVYFVFVKFRYSEKTKKIWSYLPLIFDIS